MGEGLGEERGLDGRVGEVRALGSPREPGLSVMLSSVRRAMPPPLRTGESHQEDRA